MEIRDDDLVLRPWVEKDVPALVKLVLRSYLVARDGSFRDAVMFSLLPGDLVE